MWSAEVAQKPFGAAHWPEIGDIDDLQNEFCMAQILSLGSTDARGYDVRDARVTPSDLAATVYRHLGIDLATHWTDLQGRPHPIVTEGGRPIPQLTNAVSASSKIASTSPAAVRRCSGLS